MVESSHELTLSRSAANPEVVALIERCQAGDSVAFDELVRRYQRYVFNLVYQNLGVTDDLEDIAQEVFIRIFRSIRRFRREASLESWIFKIVLNYCRTYIRRKRNWMRMFQENTIENEDDANFEIINNLPSEGCSIEEATEQQKVATDIKQAVAELPEIYREVLIMRELNELSYEEIAQILEISIGTVKSRISRARDLVRQAVQI